jgi:hypothetical protein
MANRIERFLPDDSPDKSWVAAVRRVIQHIDTVLTLEAQYEKAPHNSLIVATLSTRKQQIRTRVEEALTVCCHELPASGDEQALDEAKAVLTTFDVSSYFTPQTLRNELHKIIENLPDPYVPGSAFDSALRTALGAIEYYERDTDDQQGRRGMRDALIALLKEVPPDPYFDFVRTGTADAIGTLSWTPYALRRLFRTLQDFPAMTEEEAKRFVTRPNFVPKDHQEAADALIGIVDSFQAKRSEEGVRDLRKGISLLLQTLPNEEPWIAIRAFLAGKSAVGGYTPEDLDSIRREVQPLTR